MFCATIGQAFSELFSDTGIIPIVFVTLGLIFIVIEFAQTSRGVLGWCGAVLTAIGVAFRVADSGSFEMLFVFVFLICAVILSAHIITFVLLKRDWMLHSLALASSGARGIVRDGSFDYLLNLLGVATTDINTTGSISINDVDFTVVSVEPIEKGSIVRITAIDGENIIVKKSTEGNLVH